MGLELSIWRIHMLLATCDHYGHLMFHSVRLWVSNSSGVFHSLEGPQIKTPSTSREVNMAESDGQRSRSEMSEQGATANSIA